MNEQDLPSDTEILKGKRILFVDDRPQVLEFFVDELRCAVGSGQIAIEYVTTLAEAIEKLSRPPAFDLVVIDLYMAGEIPDALKPYAERLPKLDLNEGQALGLWLHATRPGLPYFYLSSVPMTYELVAGDEPVQHEPVNKLSESPFAFPERIAKVLTRASKLAIDE